MSKINQMFDYEGKTTKVVGNSKTQIYKKLFEYISEKQNNKELPYHGNYLGDNDLAMTQSKCRLCRNCRINIKTKKR